MARSRFFHDWGFEILTLFSSVAALVAMVVLMGFYDGKKIFDNGIITLNTIVSLLSTTSKVCLLAAISTCISQEGWVLFSRRPRRLYDLEMVSQASRGPLGSIKLLWSWNVRGAKIVRIGALVTVLAIAVEPFSQQVVQYKQTFDESEGGRIPRAVRYTKGSQYGGLMTQYEINRQGRVDKPSNETYLYTAPDFAMQGVIEYSLTSSQKLVDQQAEYSCPGVDCDFKPFESLAVCHRCEDLSERLVRTKNGTGYQLSQYRLDSSVATRELNQTAFYLPNGLFLDNQDKKYRAGDDMVYMVMGGTSDPSRSVAMKDVDTLIWAQSMIKARVDAFKDEGDRGRKWPDYEIHAAECAVYYCVKEFDVKIRNSTIQQSSKQRDDVKRNPDSWLPTGDNENLSKISDTLRKSLAYHPADSLIERTDLQLTDGKGGQWNMTKQGVDGISIFMQNLFARCLDESGSHTGSCVEAFEDWGVPNGVYMTVAHVGGGREEYQPNAAKVIFEETDFAGLWRRVATGMTNALMAGDAQGTADRGAVLHPAMIYDVDWRWFALPCFVELAGLLFFGLAVWSTARTRGRVPVWKSSELAVLSHGIHAHDALKDAVTPQDHAELAMGATVVLKRGGGVAVVGDDGGDYSYSGGGSEMQLQPKTNVLVEETPERSRLFNDNSNNNNNNNM